MTYRKVILSNNEVYHVINRSIANTPLFHNKTNYLKLLETINYYRFKNVPLRFSYYCRLPCDDRGKILSNLIKENQLLVEIISFCIMTNHIHLLLRQIADRGISIFMSKMQNSYAKYFNIVYKRKGALFQSMFKAIRIETDEQLIHVSRYIHLNPSTGYLCQTKDLINYPWSSYTHYLGLKKFEFLSPQIILNFFKKLNDYKKFIYDQADYQKELANIKHLILE